MSICALTWQYQQWLVDSGGGERGPVLLPLWEMSPDMMEGDIDDRWILAVERGPVLLPLGEMSPDMMEGDIDNRTEAHYGVSETGLKHTMVCLRQDRLKHIMVCLRQDRLKHTMVCLRQD
ncbi:hypothetical protein ACOMHN_051460 [Nucella lapillus]